MLTNNLIFREDMPILEASLRESVNAVSSSEPFLFVDVNKTRPVSTYQEALSFAVRFRGRDSVELAFLRLSVKPRGHTMHKPTTLLINDIRNLLTEIAADQRALIELGRAALDGREVEQSKMDTGKRAKNGTTSSR